MNNINIQFSSEDLKVLKELSANIEKLHKALTDKNSLLHIGTDISKFKKRLTTSVGKYKRPRKVYIDGDELITESVALEKINSNYKLTFVSENYYTYGLCNVIVVLENSNIRMNGILNIIATDDNDRFNYYEFIAQEYTVET